MPMTLSAPTSGLPGVYAQETTTPASPPRIAGDVYGFIFEASRGLPHLPQWVRDQDAFTRQFGGRTPTQADATKLLSGFLSYYAADKQGVQDALGVRVGTTKMRTARMTVLNGANAVLDLWASSPGTWANGNLTWTVAAGQATGTWDLTVTNSATGEIDQINGLPMADNAGAIAQINQQASLVYATQPVVPAPAAPTFSATASGGTVAAGTYYLQVIYLTASGGKSQASPEATVTLSGTGKLTVTVPSVTGAASWRGYIGTAAGTETFAIASSTFGSGVDITAPWAASAETVPWGPIDQTGALIAATTGAGYTAAIPTAGTFTFPTTGTGVTATAVPGDNGEGATAAQYVGSSGTPATGLYAFANMDIDEQPRYIVPAEAGGTDSTQWATLAQYGFNNNCQIVVSYPQGTSSSAVVTSWATLTATLTPQVAKHLKLAWPWATIYDTVYARDIYVSSAPYLAAVGAVTPANTSAANKVVAGLSGLEYTLSSDAAAVTLVQAAINPLSGRITPKGVGFLSDFMADGSYAYESRMKAELVQRTTVELADISDIPNNAPNRQMVQDRARNVFRGMVSDGILEDNPATTATPQNSTVVSTTGKTSANSAVGVQPSTVAAQPVSTFLHWAAQCNDQNNLDQNGIPVGPYFVLDMQMQVTRNADNVWLRFGVGIFQVITLGVDTTTA